LRNEAHLLVRRNDEVAAQRRRWTFYEVIRFSWSLRPVSLLPGQKTGAEAKKGREKPTQFPPLRFRKETRGERDIRAETVEARLGKRRITAFFGEANAFLLGHGTAWQ
ncbi:MAG: hypothetical protein H6Q43_1175, partial [Deltaproteobacteria bacterium]|nr:hypothetical protein [Deltaproteobacteria bacterium]